MAEEAGSVEVVIRARLDVLEAALADARRQLDGFDKSVAKPTAASRAFEKANQGASESLRKVAASVSLLPGPLGTAAGRVSALATGIGAVGLVAGGAGIALAGFAVIAGRALHDFAALEREQVTYNAVLRATGFAAGKTSAELEELEGSLRKVTGATESEVRRAMAVLLTFTSVSGEQFEQTLRMAKDLSVIMGGDMVSAIRMVGRASEDPAQGMMMLRRAGIMLNETQKQQIKIFTESGQRAKAFQVILDESQRRLGGAGAAQRGTLSGAFTQVSEAASNWFEIIGTRLAQVTKFNEVLNSLAATIDKVNKGMAFESSPEGLKQAVETARGEVFAARAEQALKLRAQGQAPMARGLPLPASPRMIAAVEELTRAEKALKDATNARAEAQEQAAKGKAGEDLRRRRDAIEGVVTTLNQEAEQLRMTAKERAVDDALRQAGLKLTDAQIATGDKLTQAERARITALAESIFILKNESGLVQGKIGLLGELATVDQRVAASAMQIIDAQKSGIKLTEREIVLLNERNAVRAREAIINERAQLGIGTAEELAAQKQALINQLVNQYGEEWRDVITIGIDKKFQDLADSIAVAGSRLPEFTRAMQEATNMGRQIDQGLTRSVDTLAGGLTDIVTGTTDVKTAFANMAQSILRDFTQMIIKAMLFRAVSSLIGGGGGAGLFGLAGGGGSGVGGGGGFFGSSDLGTLAGNSFQVSPGFGLVPIIHGGGVSGVDSIPHRMDTAGSYVNAPRFHDGLAPGEFRAVLKQGEGVFTPGQMRAMGRRGDTYYIDARNADSGGLARLESAIRELHGSIEYRSVAAVVDARQRNPSLFNPGGAL